MPPPGILLARPVPKNLIVSCGLNENIVKLSDLLAAYPELSTILPSPAQAAAADAKPTLLVDEQVQKAKYGKIRGWLIVLGIALVFSIFVCARILYTNLAFMQEDTFQVVADAYAGYAELMYFENALNVVLIFMVLLSGYFFLGRLRQARPLLITTYIISIVYAIIGYAWAYNLFGPELLKDVGISLAATEKAVIGQFAVILYLLRSERARLTFVR
jgi:hypothetical protein